MESMMATRNRPLSPDEKGRYRPCIGYYIAEDGQRRLHRFNLGVDKKDAQRRAAKIRELYDENVKQSGRDVWSPLPLCFAEKIAAGEQAIAMQPLGGPDPMMEYARIIHKNEQRFPSLQGMLVPVHHDLYGQSVKLNENFVASKLRDLEGEMKEIGALGGKELPDRIITGTLHEALDAYQADIEKNGARLPTGELKPHQRKRLERIARFKRCHADAPLYSLNFDRCGEIIGYWRNRQYVTVKGTQATRGFCRKHIGELDRFFDWLDLCDKFQWRKPRGLDTIKRRVEKDQQRKLSAVVKETYTVEELALLNRQATPFERLHLYLALNCAMGAAELGRLVKDDFFLRSPHPYAAKFGFVSTAADSYARYFRPKTGVFGEWLLWPETVQMVEWGLARAKKIGTDLLFVSREGEPLYDERMQNAQQRFQNMWTRLKERVRRSASIPDLPFGSLRDALPDLIRQQFSDELASVMLNHGTPCKADSLLECYANKPFGRLHEALRKLHDYYGPVFAAVDDPLKGGRS
jgi:hypothetical protein